MIKRRISVPAPLCYIDSMCFMLLTGDYHSRPAAVRQNDSGQEFFSSKPYVSFENPDTREEARIAPRSFLEPYRDDAVFDEVQRLPEILSYLKQIVDEGPKSCGFVLIGSQQFGLKSKITQSLAGRSALNHLLTLLFPTATNRA